jgi:hypothetical protein
MTTNRIRKHGIERQHRAYVIGEPNLESIGEDTEGRPP